MTHLYKTTIEILSDYNPDIIGMSVEDMARDAMNGDSYLFSVTHVSINPDDLDGDGLREFFNLDEE